MAPAETVFTGDPADPDPQQRLYLLDASSGFEQQHLEDWVREATSPGAPTTVALRPSRRRRGRVSLSALEVALAAEGDDPLLAPLRIAWLAPLRDGERTASLSDLLRFGDPRDPGALRQRWIERREPDRMRVVQGEPASLSELRERWREAGGTDTGGLADFVQRQATLALERAERRLRGARYKVPRLVHEEILRRPTFQAGIARIAREEAPAGRGDAALQKRASRYLREIAATHSRFVIDLVARLIRMIYTRGYGEQLVYDAAALGRIAALAERHPVVFLPTHKSNLDHLVLQYALHENGLPPNHTAGGINMNFFPVGPLVRRSGVFFIRRTFKDNELYKHVLRSYIDYLVEKRFSLEWYIEGGRSRSGKLLPPRFGILAYVVDAYRRARSDDVFMIPVSIAYDHILDVGSYSHEQRGGAKPKESFGWFLGFLRGLDRRHGEIHIGFGEPLSLREALGPPDPDAPPDPDERSVELQKIAFEVSVRINRATTLTPTSVVTLALLGVGDRALSVGEAQHALENLLHSIDERDLPTTPAVAELKSDEGVRAALETLVESGVVTRFDDGDEPVYRVVEEQQLTAAYYRNTIVHFFVNGAIVELSLLGAAQQGVEDPTAEFWRQAMELRDLLKFEFFFADKAAFREELRSELSFQDSDWEAQLAAGGEGLQRLIESIRPLASHRALRPFLEGYHVFAERLARCDTSKDADEAQLIEVCMGIGKQYLLQRRIHSAESISQVIFKNALELARNRELLSAGEEQQARRQAFAEEIRSTVQRTEMINALAASRRAGWIT